MTGPSPSEYRHFRDALTAPTVIRVYCAWCDAFLREIDGEGESGRSDGICPACLLEHFGMVAE